MGYLRIPAKRDRAYKRLASTAMACTSASSCPALPRASSPLLSFCTALHIPACLASASPPLLQHPSSCRIGVLLSTWDGPGGFPSHPASLVLAPPRIKHRVNSHDLRVGRVQRIDWIRIRNRKLAPSCLPSDARWTSFCIVLDASAGRLGYPLERSGRHVRSWHLDGWRSGERRCRGGLLPVQSAKDMEQSQTCRAETQAFLDVSSSCGHERFQKERGLREDGWSVHASGETRQGPRPVQFGWKPRQRESLSNCSRP